VSKIILKVNGIEFEGWKTVNVQQSLSTISGSFNFTGADIFAGSHGGWNLRMGDVCTVEIENQIVLTGYIEDINIDYDDVSHTIEIGGRDFTGDLVDCSYVGIPKVDTSFLDKLEENYSTDVLQKVTVPVLPPVDQEIPSVIDSGTVEWIGLSVSNIIDRLIRPFLGTEGLIIDSTVTTEANIRVDNFNIAEGDKVFDVIANLCRKHAILPISLGDGKLTLTRAGSTDSNDSIELGRNALKGSFRRSDKDRFNNYWVKGQDTANDNLTFSEFIGANAQAYDRYIRRNRPLIIINDDPITSAEAKTQAHWEARTRMGKSRPITYPVRGWTKTDGNVWALNSLVRVNDSFFDLDETLLISDLNFQFDENSGSVVDITVVPKETFKLVKSPVEEKAIKTEFDSDDAIVGPLILQHVPNKWVSDIGSLQ
jgi:prophage tail gpP-like protein